MPSPRISLADVARAAGVSRAAASYAMRDDPNIAPATRKRIQKIALQIGYRPDPMLGKLMLHLHASRETPYRGTLAFINPGDTRDFTQRTQALRDFFESAATRAKALGYEMEEFWLHEPGRSPQRLPQILISRGIHGIVLGSTGHPRSVVDFPWDKFAAVTVGYSVASPSLHRVVTNHYRNTRLALRRIAESGYKRVGLLIDKALEPTMGSLHLAAFLIDQGENGTPSPIPPYAYADADSEAQSGDLRRWFEQHRPDAILSGGFSRPDFEKVGIQIPQETAMASLLCWESKGFTAGVRPGYEHLGTVAINLLASQLQHDDYGVPLRPQTVQVDGVWLDGDSLPGAHRQPLI